MQVVPYKRSVIKPEGSSKTLGIADLNAETKSYRYAAMVKVSPVRRKQRIGYSLFSTRVKMDKEDNFRKCRFGFIYK